MASRGKRYIALRVISAMLRVAAGLVAVASSVNLFRLYNAAEPGDLQSALAIVFLPFVVVAALVVYAIGDLIRVVVDIEENTRRAARIARSRAEMPDFSNVD